MVQQGMFTTTENLCSQEKRSDVIFQQVSCPTQERLRNSDLIPSRLGFYLARLDFKAIQIKFNYQVFHKLSLYYQNN